MNIVFFGSSKFSTPSLKAIVAGGHNILCVVTQPDKKKGRGLRLAQTPVKITAQELGLKTYQPYSINTEETREFLKSLDSDLFVVIAYGQILSGNILDIPKIFSINAHASLLPKYRGAAPINWTIIKGEKITGVTIIKMVKEMDAGPIILQRTLTISEDDNALTLEDKLSKMAAQLIVDSLESIKNNTYKLTSQDENLVNFAPKLKKNDGLIEWNKSAEEINNLIRGCLDWPGAFTYYRGKRLKLYKSRSVKVSKCQSVKVPGEVIEVSKDGIIVVTGKDNLIIEELQIEGKRRMRVEEFIIGHRISAGEILIKNKLHKKVYML